MGERRRERIGERDWETEESVIEIAFRMLLSSLRFVP